MEAKLTRRGLLRLSVMGAAGAILAACSPSSPAPTAAPNQGGSEVEPAATAAAPQPVTGPVTIRFTHVADPGELEIRQASIADFEDRNPNIKVVAELVPEDGMDQKIVTMVAGGAAPDVVYVHPSFVPLFATQQVLAPLEDYAAKEANFDPSDFFERVVDHFVWEGKTYAYPYYSGPIVGYYNKTLFDEAGEPLPTTYTEGFSDGNKDNWTWDKMLEVAQRMTKGEGAKKVFGVMPSSASLHWFDSVVWSFGGEVWDADVKKCLLDQPKAMEAIKYQADLFTTYNVAPTDQQAEGLPGGLASGRIAMETEGIRARVPGYVNVEFEIGMMPIPKGSGGRVTRDGPNGAGLIASSKAKEATWEFIKYMVGPEPGDPGGTKFEFGMHRALPSRKSLYDCQDFMDGLLPWEDLDVYRNASQSVRELPMPARYSEVNAAWQEHWQAIITGTSTVEDAVKDAVAVIDPLLA